VSSGTDASELAGVERENRTLHKRLARMERKLESLEVFQDQNNTLMGVLMSELEQERSESERLLLNILPASIA
jgi:cell shape-determining protein MreC